MFLTTKTQTPEAMIVALEIIDRCCDDPDCCRNLEHFGGIKPLLKYALSDYEDVSMKCCEILSLMLSNNEKMQLSAFENHNALDFLCSATTPNYSKARLALLGAIVRGHATIESSFCRKSSDSKIELNSEGTVLGGSVGLTQAPMMLKDGEAEAAQAPKESSESEEKPATVNTTEESEKESGPTISLKTKDGKAAKSGLVPAGTGKNAKKGYNGIEWLCKAFFVPVEEIINNGTQEGASSSSTTKTEEQKEEFEKKKIDLKGVIEKAASFLRHLMLTDEKRILANAKSLTQGLTRVYSLMNTMDFEFFSGQHSDICANMVQLLGDEVVTHLESAKKEAKKKAKGKTSSPADSDDTPEFGKDDLRTLVGALKARLEALAAQIDNQEYFADEVKLLKSAVANLSKGVNAGL